MYVSDMSAPLRDDSVPKNRDRHRRRSTLILIFLVTRSIDEERLSGGRMLRGWRHIVGRCLCAGADTGGHGGRGAGGGRCMCRGRIQRQSMLQLQQLMVWIQGCGCTMTALVRRAHDVTPIGEAADIGWSMIMRVARTHDALVSFRAFGIYVSETARSQPRRAVPLFASVCQVVLQTESVAAVQQQSTFASPDEASYTTKQKMRMCPTWSI